MKQYVYRFVDGTANYIELPDNWADILMELDQIRYNKFRKYKKWTDLQPVW